MNPQAQGSEAAESAAAGRLARARPVVWTGRVLAAVAGVAVLGWMMLATYFSPLEPPWIRVGLAALVLVGAASGLLLVRPLLWSAVRFGRRLFQYFHVPGERGIVVLQLLVFLA